MTNMTMRMFVSGVESLATDTLGTKNLRYVQLNACSAMPLNQKNKNLGAAQSHVLKWLVTRHGKEQVLGLECMFENKWEETCLSLV